MSQSHDQDRFPAARQVWLAHRYAQDAEICGWLGDHAQAGEFSRLSARAEAQAEAVIGVACARRLEWCDMTIGEDSDD